MMEWLNVFLLYKTNNKQQPLSQMPLALAWQKDLLKLQLQLDYWCLLVLLQLGLLPLHVALSAAKSIGQMPPAYFSPELQHLQAAFGDPNTNVVMQDGRVLDAGTTRATTGHRSGNNGIKQNVNSSSGRLATA
jgi:hypothetical protein